jgi:hypothetical protein
MAGVIALAIVGAVVQYKYNKDDDEKAKKKNGTYYSV